MAQKLLFGKFLENKRIYNLNQGYWKRKIQSRLKIPLSPGWNIFNNLKNLDASGNKIYDANPIFTFINHNGTKAVRIIQDDINDMKGSIEENKDFLISAWFDNSYYYEDIKIPELVIALFLTKETSEKAINLTSQWIYGNLSDDNLQEILNNPIS